MIQTVHVLVPVHGPITHIEYEHEHRFAEYKHDS
jgi:hypothetical protein